MDAQLMRARMRLEDTYARLARDEGVQMWLELEASGPVFVNTARQVQCEQRIRALELVSPLPWRIDPKLGELAELDLRVGLSDKVERAQAYLWADDSMDVALHGSMGAEALTLGELPDAPIWFTFPTDRLGAWWPDGGVDARTNKVVGMILWGEARSALVAGILARAGETPILDLLGLEVGKPPADRSRELALAMLRLLGGADRTVVVNEMDFGLGSFPNTPIPRCVRTEAAGGK